MVSSVKWGIWLFLNDNSSRGRKNSVKHGRPSKSQKNIKEDQDPVAHLTQTSVFDLALTWFLSKIYISISQYRIMSSEFTPRKILVL